VTLADEQFTLKSACWRTTAQRLTPPAVGAVVHVYGRIDFYTAKGEVQFIIEHIQDIGESLAQAELRRLVALYQPMAKHRPIPRFPRRIGVVTSPTGAVIHDVARTIRERYPVVALVASHSSVQGEQAPPEIVNALEALYQESVDVILLVRGGGSAEDLACFNSELVAQAILRAPVPIVTGIGHEPDVTLADLVADYRAATPTAAAKHVTPDQQELLETLTARQRSLDLAIAVRCAQLDMHLEELHNRLQRAAPTVRLAHYRQQVELYDLKMHQHLRQQIDRLHGRLIAMDGSLQALAPQHVLQRGYVVVRDADNQVVRSAHAIGVHPQRLTLQFHDGTVQVSSEGTTS
jgi:exodeoxyribonuclease VII large subunit